MDASSLARELNAFDAQVDAFEQDYDAKAEGKAGIQKGMDAMRSLFNRGDDGKGYGDDQWKNIANTQHGVDKLKDDVKAGRLDAGQAHQQLQALRQEFEVTASDVTHAQAKNAEMGQLVHDTTRAVVVGGAGFVAGSAGFAAGMGVGSVPGSVVAAAAGATAAANAFDAVSKGVQEADKKLGNGAKDGQPGFALELNTKGSFAGLASNALAGEHINGKDVLNTAVTSTLDAAGGAWAGKTVQATRGAVAATHVSAQQAARQSGLNAAQVASVEATHAAVVSAVVKVSATHSVGQSGTELLIKNAGTMASDKKPDEKLAEMGTNAKTAALELPGRLVFGAAGSALAGIKPANVLADAATQWGISSTAAAGQAFVGNGLTGQGWQLDDKDLVQASLFGASGAARNFALLPSAGAREPRPASQTALPGSAGGVQAMTEPRNAMVPSSLRGQAPLTVQQLTNPNRLSAQQLMQARGLKHTFDDEKHSQAMQRHALKMSMEPTSHQPAPPLGNGASGEGFFAIEPLSSTGQELQRIDRSTSEQEIVNALAQVRADMGLTTRGQLKKNVAVLMLTNNAGQSHILGAKARADTRVELSDRLIDLPQSVPLEGGDANVFTQSDAGNLAVRAEDAERTLLESAARFIQSQSGAGPWRAVLVSELAPCAACSAAIDQFTALTGTPVETYTTAARSGGELRQRFALGQPEHAGAVSKGSTSPEPRRAATPVKSGSTADSVKPTTGEPARSPTLIVWPDFKLDFKAQSTDGQTLIVVPDTHGRDDLQQKAFDYLRRAQDWVFGDDTTVVGLGDTIDKGPNSAQNVEDFINRKDEPGIKQVLSHVGNHELWLTEWLKNPHKLKYAHDWIANRGGAIALQSYDRFAKANPELSNFSLDGIDLKQMPVKEVTGSGGGTRVEPDNSSGFYSRLYDRVIEGLPRTHLEFFSELRLSTRIGDYFFSHAGADPKVSLDEQGLGALTWIRDPYLRYEGDWMGEPNTVAVSGHTVLTKPLIQSNKFAIDLGTFMTNDFMVAVLKNDLVRFAIFRHGEEPLWTDLRKGFDDKTFSPSFDPSQVIKNKKTTS